MVLSSFYIRIIASPAAAEADDRTRSACFAWKNAFSADAWASE
jgi:hypothetical protein